MSERQRVELKTVLSIDDNDVNLKLFSRIRVRAGYRVLEARTGEEGLALARKEQPHVVLMDVKRPGMDGFEATRQLKAEPLLAGMPVIIITAAAMVEDKAKAIEVGCNEFPSKPFHIQELVQTIRRTRGE
jgi:two-component system, cell cycle response regulator DivK